MKILSSPYFSVPRDQAVGSAVEWQHQEQEHYHQNHRSSSSSPSLENHPCWIDVASSAHPHQAPHCLPLRLRFGVRAKVVK